MYSSVAHWPLTAPAAVRICFITKTNRVFLRQINIVIVNKYLMMNRLPAIVSRHFLVQHIQNAPKRQIHVTALNLDITWRRDRRLPKNPTSSGPLTELPDYTFMDGRPTPMGVRMKSRVEYQRELAKKIIQGIREVDSAKAGHQQRLQAKEAERQNILDSKLKPKGKLLAKKS